MKLVSADLCAVINDKMFVSGESLQTIPDDDVAIVAYADSDYGYRLSEVLTNLVKEAGDAVGN